MGSINLMMSSLWIPKVNISKLFILIVLYGTWRIINLQTDSTCRQTVSRSLDISIWMIIEANKLRKFFV